VQPAIHVARHRARIIYRANLFVDVRRGEKTMQNKRSRPSVSSQKLRRLARFNRHGLKAVPYD
jgi:hypothetical protein